MKTIAPENNKIVFLSLSFAKLKQFQNMYTWTIGSQLTVGIYNNPLLLNCKNIRTMMPDITMILSAAMQNICFQLLYFRDTI